LTALSFALNLCRAGQSLPVALGLLLAAAGSLSLSPAAYAGELDADTPTVLETSENHETSAPVTIADLSDDLSSDDVNGEAIAPLALDTAEDTDSVQTAAEPADAPMVVDVADEAGEAADLDIPLAADDQPTGEGAAMLGLYEIGITSDSMAQVTSVTQLSDVRPTDWAYQALLSLIERYGCIAGYPDGTFRGNQALTRYEFAAGLNACLDALSRVTVATGDATLLGQLQQEFAGELASLRGRVDSLEARISTLEASQFSTTSKLFGQVVVGVQGRNNYEFAIFRDVLENRSQPNLVTNVQLNLLTQFDSRSILLLGLQGGAGNTSNTPGLSDFTRFAYEGDTNNSIELSDVSFRHLIGRDLALIVGPQGVNAVNTFRGANRVESAGFGPLSRFAQRNPIIGIGSGSGGVGLDWQLANWASFQAIYTASSPTDNVNGGLFGGDNGVTTIGGQLVLSPSRDFDISLQYINSYSPFGRLFSGVGDDQVAVVDGATGRAPIQTNAFGTTLEWRVAESLTAGGWVGFANSNLLGQSGSVDTFNWMAFLNFPDLLGEGNMAGIYVGQPPKITSSNLPLNRNIPSLINRGEFPSTEGGQPSTTTHVEAFYRWRVTDNISITPGFVLLFNPGHNASNDTIFMGALRTTFTF
jgi:hypothetical protein